VWYESINEEGMRLARTGSVYIKNRWRGKQWGGRGNLTPVNRRHLAKEGLRSLGAHLL